jgi:hypothetical protein
MEASCQLHVPVALPPGEETPGSNLHRRLGGPQMQYGCYGEKKNFFGFPYIYFIELSLRIE